VARYFEEVVMIGTDRRRAARPVRALAEQGAIASHRRAVGVCSTLKFTKYLRDFGWSPSCGRRGIRSAALGRDPARDVPPGTRVCRTPAFEFERLEHRLGRLMVSARRTAAERSLGERSDVAAPAAGLRRSPPDGPDRVLVPDPQIAWLPAALSTAW
jgi:hypothetical protein